jgi:1-acyl-sn-glycerol-3-phosphate acyltransferase
MSQTFGRTILVAMGWKIEGRVPSPQSCIIIGAPHTSNWDFVIAMAVRWAIGLDVRWIGKHTLFKGIAGPFMRFLGGIPINRSQAEGFVDNVVETLRANPGLIIGLAPEGTRKPVPNWKSGFYRMAAGANIPLLPIAFDYPSKTLHIWTFIYPTSGLEADAPMISAFYKDKRGKGGRGISPILPV